MYVLSLPLVALVYRYAPSVNTLYALALIVNYVGWAVMFRTIFRASNHHDADQRFLWFYSLVLASHCFGLIVTAKVNMVSLACPLVAVLYYCVVIGHRFAYVLTALALCLISEDVALFVLSFSVYVWLFEPARRRLAYVSFAIAFAYATLVIAFIQPAVRHDLGQSSYLAIRLARTGDTMNVLKFVAQSSSLLLFLPAFAMTHFLAGRRRWTDYDWPRLAGLVFIAPASYWLICFVYGGFNVHHELMILSCVLLALAEFSSQPSWKPAIGFTDRRVWLLLAFFILTNGALNVRDIGGTTLVRGVLGRTRSGDSLGAAIQSNRAVIAAMQSIPLDRTVVYWTNRTVEAFVVDRPDVWRFPYLWDRADFLVIEREAKESFFGFDADTHQDLRDALAGGRLYSSTAFAPITPTAVHRIENELVRRRRSHTVRVANEHVLILERMQKEQIDLPSTTVGLGWTKNVYSGAVRKNGDLQPQP
jgi:hypothetical protein